jgi:hypothetical protein
MKLAFVNASIVRPAAIRDVTLRSRTAASIPLRTFSARPPKARHAQLAAHWHVSPETGRIESRWSLDEAPADDSLCRRRSKAKRARLNPLRHARERVGEGKARRQSLTSDYRG